MARKIELADVRRRAHAGPFQGFDTLIRFRVEDILLVSSLYDSFILSEDGKIHELMLDEMLDLNLRRTPGLTHVSSGHDALDLARDEARYNLIIASTHMGDMNALELTLKLRSAGIRTPVVLLAYDSREVQDFVGRQDVSTLERIFLWQGDVRILLAIMKYVEDKWNVVHDTGEVGVQAVIVIEDNIRFYSSYLPMIYTEVMKHSQNLLPEGINLSHKMMRIRARPKVLLCSAYEEAWDYFSKYQDEILGVISDIQFPRGGELCRDAGLEFAQQVRRFRTDIPIMLQSSYPENEALARDLGASFMLKGSPVLLDQLRQFLVNDLGFGAFVFRLPDGTEVGRARDMKSMVRMLHTVPAESLAFHGERNHFSAWLKARTEFALAERLRPRKVSDFPTMEDLRQDVIRSINEYRREQNRGMVADFERTTFDTSSSFSRIGGGSMGGKARGLAFVNRLLSEYRLDRMFPGMRIVVPPSVVLGTDVFDRFIEDNGLRDFALRSHDDEEIRRRFLEASVSKDIEQDLASFLEMIRYPLAVRSSSLLEDSQYQPFAGIYETYMLPNNSPDPAVRLGQLLDAVKQVYASMFSKHAKAYLRSTPYRLEEEKMAVIVQKVVGAAHGRRFYPDFAGVARSYNFYPTGPMQGRDGIAAVALGLGKTVCEGGSCIRFCPKYPQHVVELSSVKDILQNSQREFFALDLEDGDGHLGRDGRIEPRAWGLDAAEADGTLAILGSTYSHENRAVYDGISRPGVRLVSFAPILKQSIFPLAEILDTLLDIGVQGTRSPVELEFAVNLFVGPDEPKEFGFLQMRPLPLSRDFQEFEIGDLPAADLICRSSSVLGHGVIADIHDVVVVDYYRFDRSRSLEVAHAVERFNAELMARSAPYLLIGVGRWGSADPLLGIPVTWDQINGVRVIVEAGLRDLRVSPSQGTHFFQNLTTSNVGYFTVNPEAGEGFVDWDWLVRQAPAATEACVSHLRFERPVVVKMDGRHNHGVILKPGAGG